MALDLEQKFDIRIDQFNECDIVTGMIYTCESSHIGPWIKHARAFIEDGSDGYQNSGIASKTNKGTKFDNVKVQKNEKGHRMYNVSTGKWSGMKKYVRNVSTSENCSVDTPTSIWTQETWTGSNNLCGRSGQGHRPDNGWSCNYHEGQRCLESHRRRPTGVDLVSEWVRERGKCETLRCY